MMPNDVTQEEMLLCFDAMARQVARYGKRTPEICQAIRTLIREGDTCDIQEIAECTAQQIFTDYVEKYASVTSWSGHERLVPHKVTSEHRDLIILNITKLIRAAMVAMKPTPQSEKEGKPDRREARGMRVKCRACGKALNLDTLTHADDFAFWKCPKCNSENVVGDTKVWPKDAPPEGER